MIIIYITIIKCEPVVVPDQSVNNYSTMFPSLHGRE